MTDATAKEQMECLEKQLELEKDAEEIIKFRPQDAVVLYPALGNPAVIKQEKNKSILELLVLCKEKNLQQGEAAFHLRLSPWSEKDNGNVRNYDDIWKNYNKNKNSVVLSPCYEINENTFGEGGKSPDFNDKFKLKLGHINVFPWVLKALSQYGYLYKVSIDLQDKPKGMYNIWWVTEQDYHEVKDKPKWWNLAQHIKDINAGALKMPRPFKKELKEFGGVIAQSDNEKENENIRASIYHPIYITQKPNLDFGHITDVHLDSRMDVYGQSEVSVIEVEENYPVVADGDSRKITKKEFHSPIKNKIANFNKIFTDICNKLISGGADSIVITGDLVDYNRGIHTPQTYKKCFTKISEVWKQLGSKVSKEKFYRDDRNWFLFYKKMLELYNKGGKAVPVFTILGNHDYVNYGMAPWPLFGLPWNGVFDQNLTLYESALCFGKKYKSNAAFIKDVIEKTNFVEWYTIFINPFADFVLEYGNQSMYMVDWGVKSNITSSLATGSGGLHHARHLFKDKSDFEHTTTNESGITTTRELPQPFPMKNYSIYKSWLKSNKIKILFMHATAICPKDNVSVGQINHDLEWTDSKLRFGSFDSRRNEIIKDVEDGKLDIIVSGHSHRNVVMEVSKNNPKKAKVLSAGEVTASISQFPSNLIMVTSSGGPLPKYIPGGPKICSCTEEYQNGWDYDTKLLGKNELFRYKGKAKNQISALKCRKCKMPADEMVAKKAKRHKPGGNLLIFHTGKKSKKLKVKIKSVFASDKLSKPRLGVMCDENKVFTKSMKFEVINNYEDFKDWDKKKPISIISRQSFKNYGYMDFPNAVEYITFLKESKDGKIKGLRAEKKHPVSFDKLPNNKVIIRQFIGKAEFERLKKSAERESDFGFTRYYFTNEKWDREIKILKEKEYLTGYEEDTFNPRQKDPFKALTISFKRKPDLNKRIEICGY